MAKPVSVNWPTSQICLSQASAQIPNYKLQKTRFQEIAEKMKG